MNDPDITPIPTQDTPWWERQATRRTLGRIFVRVSTALTAWQAFQDQRNQIWWGLAAGVLFILGEALSGAETSAARNAAGTVLETLGPVVRELQERREGEKQ